MAFKFDQSDDVLAEINVVPLVDVILVVLIIFMVTAPMIMKPSISVNLPKSGSGDSTKPSKLSISISAAGQLQLDGKNVSENEISEAAKQEFAKNPDVQAIISADKDVAHGKVVSILDVVKSVGVKRFAISIDKK
ncbi:MAG: ExbD/TolR family protein [Pseudobdellovibrio sp.]